MKRMPVRVKTSEAVFTATVAVLLGAASPAHARAIPGYQHFERRRPAPLTVGPGTRCGSVPV
jgi:hypothetical protein